MLSQRPGRAQRRRDLGHHGRAAPGQRKTDSGPRLPACFIGPPGILRRQYKYLNIIILLKGTSRLPRREDPRSRLPRSVPIRDPCSAPRWGASGDARADPCGAGRGSGGRVRDDLGPRRSGQQPAVPLLRAGRDHHRRGDRCGLPGQGRPGSAQPESRPAVRAGHSGAGPGGEGFAAWPGQRGGTAAVPPGDRPVVVICATASVRDSDIQANTDRYVRDFLRDHPLRVPWEQDRERVWYYARIYIECTPRRVLFWPAGTLGRGGAGRVGGAAAVAGSSVRFGPGQPRRAPRGMACVPVAGQCQGRAGGHPHSHPHRHR